MDSYIKQGDCLELMKEMPDESIDAIICDPPYCINYTSWDNVFDISTALKHCFRILKPNGNFLLFQGWSNVCQTIAFSEDVGFTLNDWIIYDRIKGRGAKKRLVSTREDILWLVKSEQYTFNKIPSSIVKKTSGLGTKNGQKYRALSNVWTDISPIVPWSKERVSHPTQKPLQLMHRCIEVWTSPGDTVLDFCMGSGTTCVAAKNLNRRYVGFELDENYFNIAKERIENAS